ncbi:MAG: hypothetical protein KJ922_05330, partial [Nanoarchaeota archaeon]|nr:hypothetical protein [Nanoarchaeota archaeon]
MGRTKKIFTNSRVIILLIFLFLALIAIRPDPSNTGVAIKSVIKNSTASIAGLENPRQNAAPMSREVIKTVNNVPIYNMEDYNQAMTRLQINRSVIITTDIDTYRLVTREIIEVTELNETELKNVTEEIETESVVEVYNETTDQTVNKTVIERENVTKEVEVPKLNITHTGLVEDIGIRVGEAPKNNIKKGLDLQGGTRVLLKPEEVLSKNDMDTLIENMKERLNVYGLSDLVIRSAEDLS